MVGTWKVPEIEGINRTFNEGTRFYNTCAYQRKHGLKYVPPPVAENVQTLQEEARLYELKSKYESLTQNQK